MSRVASRAAEAFQKPKTFRTKDFLENEFQLPDFGEYDFYHAPYFLGVAMALDDPDIDEVDLMKAAQIGWTYFLIGYIFKRIVEARVCHCPIMMLFAKAGDGKAFHDEKLVPAGQATPAVAKCVDFSTTRKSGNRWDSKTFEGGFLKLVGSNSPGNVKSTSKVGVGVVEEPDDTADNVAGQGDAIGLLEERLKRYEGSKLIVGGTPAVKGLSKTEERLKLTDQRQLPIVCHECGESHVLDFENVVWDTQARDTEHPVFGYADPYTATYVCPHCAVEWDDYQRQENIRDTCFDAYNAGDKMCGWVATAELGTRAGFIDLNELYVCMPGTTLGKVVEDYLAAKAALEKGDDTLMRKFVNQKLGQAYEYQSDNATADDLRERALDYPELIVPQPGLMLLAGIDIQRDRIAIDIRAYGKGMESWLIYFGEIWAQHSINDPEDPCWTELDRLLFGSYRHESGAILRITAASLDTSDGVTQDGTYAYVRDRRKKGVNLMAIKGANSLDAPMVRLPKKIDLNATNTKAAKFGLEIWSVGTQLIKDQISGRMQLEGSGPGRMHCYAGVRTDYFDQITGEVKAPSKKQRNKMEWQQKSGQPVEAWDCEVYCHHAALVEKLHVKKADWWADKEHSLLQVDLLADNDPDDLVTRVDHKPGQVAEVTQDELGLVIEDQDQPETGTITLKPRSSTTRTISPRTIKPNSPPPTQPKRSMADLGRLMSGR